MRTGLYKILCVMLALSLIAGIAIGCYSTPDPTVQTPPATQITTGIPTTLGGTTLAPTTAPTTVPTTVPTEPTTVPTVPTTVPTEPTTVPTTTQQPAIDPSQFPKLHGKYGFMYDTRTSQFLYLSADAETSWYPASTTKMFTVYIALQHLAIDQVITVGDELDLVMNDASVAKFQKGDILTVMDIVYGVLLPSGCDAAYILAVNTGRILLDNPEATAAEAAEAFVAEMNRLAGEMGMVNTHFVTADGYHDPEHYISLQAFAMIAQLCVSNEHYVTASSTHVKYLTVKNTNGTTRTLYLRSTNKLLNQYSRFYNKNVVGLKTGSHSYAGANLIAAFKVEGGHIIIGLFGYFGDWDLRFTDANALFKHYKTLEEQISTPAQ